MPSKKTPTNSKPVKRTNGDKNLTVFQVDFIRKNHASSWHDASIDEDGNVRVNASRPLMNIGYIIQESILPKPSFFESARYAEQITNEINKGRTQDQAEREVTRKWYQDVQTNEPVKQCLKLAQELFMERLGVTLQRETNRLVKECATEAIVEIIRDEDILRRAKMVIQDETIFDRSRYGLKPPGRPRGSKVQKTTEAFTTEQEKKKHKIVLAIQKLSEGSKGEVPKDKAISTQIEIDVRTLRNWRRDLGLDTPDKWEDFKILVMRKRKNKLL